jgi:branched-chain amino acid transport system ATP-binding protein
VLEVRDLRKSFGSLTVTDGVSLALAKGAREAVIGPNGAGKTTLFNLLSGELRPDSGAVLFQGEDVTGLPPDARARQGLVRSFQRNNLFMDMTVGESLATAVAVARRATANVWAPFAGAAAHHRRAAEIADQVGLAERRGTLARHLSYGSQRQLEIGLALAAEPKLLLLDEPTAGMSPEETRGMQRLIAALPRDMTLLLIEHDMDVVFDMAERITVLDYGKVIVAGPPAEIRASPVVRQIYLGEAAA